MAKRPELLILDEPVASLDPLARREFLQSLMEAVVEHGLSVVLSSHLVADLERVCDYLVVLVASRVPVAGDVDELLAAHHRLTGPRRDTRRAARPTRRSSSESHTDRQSTLLVRTDEPVLDPAWTVEPVGLEDLVLAYMRQDGREAASAARGAAAGAAMIWLSWRQFRAQAAVRLRSRSRSSRSSSVVTGPAVCAHCYHRERDHGLHAATTATSVINAFVEQATSWLQTLLSIVLLVLLPALIGMFWGAPLVARELETGTYRLAWTQSVTRTRWLAAKLAVVGLASMARGRPASACMVTWWSARSTQVNSEPVLGPTVFAERGIVARRLRRVRLRARRHRRRR